MITFNNDCQAQAFDRLVTRLGKLGAGEHAKAVAEMYVANRHAVFNGRNYRIGFRMLLDRHVLRGAAVKVTTVRA